MDNPKGKMESFEESEIYERYFYNWNWKYYGSSRRAIRIHYTEHLDHIKYGMSKKSSVSYHVLNFGDSVDNSSLKLSGMYQMYLKVKAWIIMKAARYLPLVYIVNLNNE